MKKWTSGIIAKFCDFRSLRKSKMHFRFNSCVPMCITHEQNGPVCPCVLLMSRMAQCAHVYYSWAEWPSVPMCTTHEQNSTVLPCVLLMSRMAQCAPVYHSWTEWPSVPLCITHEQNGPVCPCVPLMSRMAQCAPVCHLLCTGGRTQHNHNANLALRKPANPIERFYTRNLRIKILVSMPSAAVWR
jgi:3-hydroxymyristoyl/3-hydroxydecanoyl-(acyl carrier protein) dehydratase